MFDKSFFRNGFVYVEQKTIPALLAYGDIVDKEEEPAGRGVTNMGQRDYRRSRNALWVYSSCVCVVGVVFAMELN